MRAVQITRFGGPEVMDVVDLPDPTPGPGQQLYEVSSAGVKLRRHPPGPVLKDSSVLRALSKAAAPWKVHLVARSASVMPLASPAGHCTNLIR